MTGTPRGVPSDPVGGKAHLAAALPYIEAEVQKRQQIVIGNAFGLLSKGELTDARAKELWIEMAVLSSLGRSFRSGVIQDAAKAAKMFEGND